MLKAVVQEQHFRIEPVDGRTGGDGAVAGLEMGYLREGLSKLAGFVVLLAGRGAIAATHERHLGAECLQPAGEPFHHWRFAGAPEREISDADYRYADMMDGGSAVIVPVVAKSN